MPEVITDNIDLWTSALFTKSTAGRGSNGRVEAYGIKKLRELILELAVRGKLVPQEPNDEPATELLRKTVYEKRRLVKANVLRDSKAPLYPNEPPDHELPSGWAWTNLYEIGEISPRNDAEDAIEASFVPMQLISEKYGDPMQHEVKLWKEIKNGFTHFKEEDVVLAKITPCFQNGKSTVIRGLTNGFGSGTTELHVYRSINACTVPEYVLIYLKSPRFISDGIPKMTGTAGQKRITRDYFAGNLFPLPPFAEQHRIVAKVDELMALCDQLEQQQTNNIEAHQTLIETLLGTLTNVESQDEFTEAWTRIAKHFDTLFTTEQSIDQLKQTILQLAVMGKLVPQDPSDETAMVLLKRIAKDKKLLAEKGKIKRQKQLPDIDIKEKLFSLPTGWEWCRLQEIVYLLGDGLHGTPEYTADERYYFINGNNLSEGKILIKPGTKTVAQDQYDKYKKNLGENTVLVSINGTLGSVAFYDNEEIILGKSACYFNLAEDIYKQFIKVVIDAPSFTEYAIKNATGSTINNLGLNAMNSLPVALPPKEEQHRIVAKVNELMTLCDALKARLAAAQTTQIHLADTIVEQAVA